MVLSLSLTTTVPSASLGGQKCFKSFITIQLCRFEWCKLGRFDLLINKLEERLFMEVVEPSIGLVFLRFIPKFGHMQVLAIILPCPDLPLLHNLPPRPTELRRLTRLPHVFDLETNLYKPASITK